MYICEACGTDISIRALREEGDLSPSASPLLQKISIHALREEGDNGKVGATTISSLFLSTPSARRATGLAKIEKTPEPIFLSTPSVRRATAIGAKYFEEHSISIHALREEGDYRK